MALGVVSYCGPAPFPSELMGRWNLDPVLAAVLCGTALIIVLRPMTGARRGLLLAGLGLLAVVWISPFCALGVSLFSARVLHHGLLAAIVAPLIACGLPGRRLPLAVTTAAQAVVFWLWHAPDAYEAAVRNDAVFWVMQASLLASATAFWMAVRRASPPAAVAGLLATMVQTGLLGALITFAGSALYAPHLLTTQAFGLTALEDQQLGGLIMWAPMSLAYLVPALVLIARWLGPDPARRPAAA